MAFIRMRSPSKAPPLRRREGSTEMMAMVLWSKSARKRRTSSSTSELLPAPPVPVMPSTGMVFRPVISFPAVATADISISLSSG